MQEESTSTAFVVEEIVPALSAALGRLHRSPDKSESWVEKVLGSLQRRRSADYHRLCRRLGFAQRLSQMAGLRPDEQAVMALGLFFKVLAADAATTGKPSRPWSDYLLRNEEWLAPCFAVMRAVDSGGWDDIADKSSIVAKVAVIFDEETVERHARPLQVIGTLTEADSAIVQQIIPLLWSEEGQELCDHHFRRLEHGYRLDGSSIREGLQLLKPVPVRPAAEAPAAPQRFSRVGTRKPPRQAAEAPAPPQSDGQENFQRRRQALRAGPGWGALLGVPKDEGRAAESQEQATTDIAKPPQEHTPDAADKVVAHVPVWRPAALPSHEEVPMTIHRISAQRPDPDGGDLVQQIEQIRSQFEQIQRIANEGQRALTSLGSQLEEIASWMTELEAIVYRWSGGDSGDRAA